MQELNIKIQPDYHKIEKIDNIKAKQQMKSLILAKQY